jgi:NifU-like protein
VQRMQIIMTALDEIRPYLKQDGGDVELVDIDGKNVYVKLSGACSGCQMATVTIEGIQSKLVEKLGELVRVIPHTMMAAE